MGNGIWGNREIDQPASRKSRVENMNNSYWGDNGLELYDTDYHLYIDETGSAGYWQPKSNTKKINKNFILTGLLILPDRIPAIEERCNEIKEKFGYEHDEIKYMYILPPDSTELTGKQIKLLDDLLSVAIDELIPMFCIIADKVEHRKCYQEPEDEHEYTRLHMIWKVTSQLQYSNAGNVKIFQDQVEDDLQPELEKTLSSRMDDFIKNGYRGSRNQPFYGERIIHNEFVNSKKHIGIQLADICCGAVRELVFNNTPHFYNKLRPLMSKFNKDGPYIHPSRCNFEDEEEAERIKNLIAGPYV